MHNFRDEINKLPLLYQESFPQNCSRLSLMELPDDMLSEFCADFLDCRIFSDLNRYPVKSGIELKKLICNHHDLSSSASVLLTNGLMEAIQLICGAFSKPNAKMLILAPTFFMYQRAAIASSMQLVKVDLNSDFTINLDATLYEIRKNNPSLIFIDFPSNPSGKKFDINKLKSIIEETQALVVIDEAYGDYVDFTWASELNNYDNLVVLKSFSKIGLAGIRLGYIMSSIKIISYLSKYASPFPVNTLSLEIGAQAIRNFDFFKSKLLTVKTLREALYNSLEKLVGITPYMSMANFILFKVDSFKSKSLYNFLLEKNIYINDLSGAHLYLDSCLRVAVGSQEENDHFLKSLNFWINNS